MIDIFASSHDFFFLIITNYDWNVIATILSYDWYFCFFYDFFFLIITNYDRDMIATLSRYDWYRRSFYDAFHDSFIWL